MSVPIRPISSLANAATLIVPAILVPPTTIDHYAPVPGIPVPDAGNLSAVARPQLSGGFIPDTPGATLVIEAGQPRGLFSTMKLRRTWLGGDDGAQVGVETQFQRWPSSAQHQLATPQGQPETPAWTATGRPQLFIAGDGSLQCAYIAVNPNGSGDCRLVVRRYDESIHSDWQHYADSGSLRTLLQGTIGANSATIGAMCALPVGRVTYLLAFGVESTVCQFYVLRLRGTTWSVVGSAGAKVGGYGLTTGASMCELPRGGFLVSFGKRTTNDATNPSRWDVQFAMSPTLEGWAEDAQSGVINLPRPADVRRVGLPLDPTIINRRRERHKITSTKMISATFGWSTTEAGAILVTTDGGSSWSMQSTPTHAGGNPRGKTYPLRNVAGYETSGVYTGFAVGDGGMIIKTTDSGATWKVLRYGAEALFKKDGSGWEINTEVTELTPAGVAFFADASVIPTEPGTFFVPKNLYAIDVNQLTTVLYVGGEGGTLASSTDGGTTFTNMAPETSSADSGGAIREIISDQFSSIMACGDSTAFERWGASVSGSNAAIFAAASTASPIITGFKIGDRANLIAAACPTRNIFSPILSSGPIYVASADGEVFRWKIDAIDRIASLGSEVVDIAAFGNDPGLSQAVVIAGRDKVSGWGFWRCEAAQVVAPEANPEQGPVFVFNSVGQFSQPIASVDMTAATSAILGAQGEVYVTTSLDSDRVYPCLLRARNAVIFACANMTTGLIEVYRGEQPGEGKLPAFTRVLGDPKASGNITFGDEAPFLTIPGTVPQPALTEDDLGNIILACGTTRTRASADNGETWVHGTHSTLPIHVGVVQSEVIYSDQAHNRSRSICAFGHRIFSTVTNVAGGSVAASTRIGTFASREWKAGGVALPVPVDRPATLFDGVKAKWLGTPAPGDSWTCEPDSRYPARNILVESPQIYWRGPATSGALTPERVILFDRQSEDVVEQIGPGHFWGPIHAFSLFGNFERVRFAISSPADDSVFTEYESTSVMLQGMAAAVSSSSAGVVRDHSLRTPTGEANPLAPHRLACPIDIHRDWLPAYMTINDLEGQVRAFRIVDHDGTVGGITYMLDTTLAAQVPGQIASAYRVWCGNHFWNGIGGTGPGSVGLANSRYAYGRYVRITIPEQPTAEGYFLVKAMVIGPSLDPQPPADSTDWARSIAPGFLYANTPNTSELAALNSVSAVEHFDRFESLAIGIKAAPRWYVDRLMGLLDRRGEMRRMSCWVFDSSNPRSARLFRLADAPQLSHALAKGDHYDIEATIRGVA